MENVVPKTGKWDVFIPSWVFVFSQDEPHHVREHLYFGRRSGTSRVAINQVVRRVTLDWNRGILAPFFTSMEQHSSGTPATSCDPSAHLTEIPGSGSLKGREVRRCVFGDEPEQASGQAGK